MRAAEGTTAFPIPLVNIFCENLRFPYSPYEPPFFTTPQRATPDRRLYRTIQRAPYAIRHCVYGFTLTQAMDEIHESTLYDAPRRY